MENNDNILVTIIINNYNYADFIKKAIDSSLEQTYSNIEIIVVDDGSKDFSKKYIDEYGDKIKPIFKENGGQASAFNKGFEAAKGDLVLFLDSDDYLLINAVEEVIDVYKKNKNISKVQFKLRRMMEGTLTNDTSPIYFENENNEEIREQIIRKWWYNTPPTSGNVFTLSFLRMIMPIPEKEYRICADEYLCIHAPFKGNIYTLDKVLGIYRIHGKNNWSCKDGDIELNSLKNLYSRTKTRKELMKSIYEYLGISKERLQYPFWYWRMRLILSKTNQIEEPFTFYNLIIAIKTIFRGRKLSTAIFCFFWINIVYFLPLKNAKIQKAVLDNWDFRNLRRMLKRVGIV